jgi:N4-gp56 family major capsid protein
LATDKNPMATTGTATQYVLATYYNKLFIERLIPTTRWYQACAKRPLPKNSGKSLKFSGYKALAAGSARVTEGTTPSPSVLSSYNINATLYQWGRWVAVSDFLELTAISSVVKEAAGVITDDAANYIDQAIRMSVWYLPSATSNISASMRARYTGSVSVLSALEAKVAGFTIKLTKQCSGLLAATGRLSTVILHATSAYLAASKVTMKDLRACLSLLRARNVKPHDGTYYLGIAHPYDLAEFMDDTSTGGWIDWQKYVSSEPFYKGEVGRAEGIKFVSTTNACGRALNRGTSVSAAVYTIMGKDALACIDVNSQGGDGGAASHVIIKRGGGSQDTADPMDLLAGTIAWKATFASVVLNTSCGVHLVGVRY